MQGIAQKILENPSRYSISELQQAMTNGVVPAYIAIPIIQQKVQDQKRAKLAEQAQGAPEEGLPSIAQNVMAEARGVTALPSNLPAQYAEGGIVAFGDGGEVERYQNKGYVYETPYDRMNRLNREQAAKEEAERIADLQARGVSTMPYKEQMSNLLGIVPNAIKTLVSAPGYGLSNINPFSTGAAQSTPDIQPTAQPAPAAQPAAQPAAPASAAPPSTGTGINAASILSRTPGLGLQRPTISMPEGPSYESSAKGFYGRIGAEAEARDVEAEQKIATEREKIKSLAYEDYKKSLEQEAKDAGADKEQAKYTALLKAGLAMMAGTSRHALENIGKGAMVGVEDFQAASKDLKQAEKERQKQLAYIEQARRAEQLGDRDKAIENIEKARDRKEARDRFVGEGIFKATNLDKAQSYDLAKTQFSADSDAFKTDLAGRYSLAGHEISGQYALAAARERAANSMGLTPSFMLRAMGKIDEDALAARVLKDMGLKKAPPPTDKKSYDIYQSRLDQAYQQELGRIVGRATGRGTPGSAGNPFAGFRIVPESD